MRFDTHAHATNLRDRILLKNFFNKKPILASRLGCSKSPETIPHDASVTNRVIFLSDGPNELFERLRLVIHEKQSGNDTNRFDEEIVEL